MKFSLCISFVLFFMSHSSFIHAQSLNNINLQNLTTDKLLQLEDINNLEYINNQEKNIQKELVSASQKINNIDELNNLNLNPPSTRERSGEKSILKKYFAALTDEVLNIYGASEFDQYQDSSLLFFNSVGEGYKFAPGDVIDITITGLNASNKSYQVIRNGTILLDKLYPINVNGLTADQVNKIITEKVILDDASAEVFVRLKSARLVTVQISGNVTSPRTIAVPAYTPLSRVIAYSGGISDSGSLRTIFLSQDDSATQTIDYYDFLQNHSNINDPLIKTSARIFVPNKGTTIAVTGFVDKPGIYELRKDVMETKVSEILALAGSSFLPLGATFKISYFDKKGKITSRMVSKNDSIRRGEALIIDFVETRELNISKIYGSVLEDYELLTNKAISIKKALKDGAVLDKETFTSFALILGKEVRAIDLNDALEDERITLPTGHDLRLFTKEEYLLLVNEDPNNTLNTLVSRLPEANIAEIYLDGVRIAYIPIEENQSFNETIDNYYIPNPKTVYDLALLESNTIVEAFDFKLALRGNFERKLRKGDKLFIFEDRFFKQLISDQEDNIPYDITNTELSNKAEAEYANLEVLKIQQEINDKEKEYQQNVEYTKKILYKSNIIKISLDSKLFTILPFSKGISSSSILKKFKGRLPKITNEFVIIENTDNNSAPRIKNLNYEFKIEENEAINLVSQDTYRKLINSYNSTYESSLMIDIKESDAVEVYYDEKLALLLSPNIAFYKEKKFDKITNSNNFYELYISLSAKNKNNNSWTLRSYDAATFFSDKQNIISSESNKVYMFSEQYIRDKFVNNPSDTDHLKNNVSKNINEDIGFQVIEDSTKTDSLELVSTEVMDNKNIDAEIRQTNKSISNHVLKSMNSNLRYVTGAVIFPGKYPLADRIRLSDLINVVGLINSKASSNVVVTRALIENGKLVKSEPEVIKLDSLMENEIILSGEFYVDVPQLVNESIDGFINLSGEFVIPGNYAFSSMEPLSEIIQRAGGLTDAAYPLGAVLERETIKVQEKKSNQILASQLEASVISLAQSDIEGVGAQIQAVLGFAQQLRKMPTTGRMTVNILDANNTLYLQDGDKLLLPKRPSHVSIIGAVQSTTVASYDKNKTLKDYIASAGGFTKTADIRKSYLLLPNGESRLVFDDVVIPVGSVIVIPPKIDKLSVLGLTDIISRVLGNIATSILAINNVN